MPYHYHHIGLITDSPRFGETYNEKGQHYASGYFTSEFGIEWLRFEGQCPLPYLIKHIPHVAFVVDDIDRVTTGKKIIFGPHEPADGVLVCFIEMNGIPIEFLHFSKPESEIWPNEHKLIKPTHHDTDGSIFRMKYISFNYPDLLFDKIKQQTVEGHPFGINTFSVENEKDWPTVLKKVPHLAFEVDQMEVALQGKEIIVAPHKVEAKKIISFIEENGVPIKFVQKIN